MLCCVHTGKDQKVIWRRLPSTQRRHSCHPIMPHNSYVHNVRECRLAQFALISVCDWLNCVLHCIMGRYDFLLWPSTQLGILEENLIKTHKYSKQYIFFPQYFKKGKISSDISVYEVNKILQLPCVLMIMIAQKARWDVLSSRPNCSFG